MKKGIRKFLATLGVLILVVLVIGGTLAGIYMARGIEGLLRIPGVTAILGLDRPKDLGMEPVTEADQESLQTKLGSDPATWVDVPDTTPRMPVQVELTPRETAAFLMEGGEKSAFRDLQVAIGEGDSIQAAGIVDLEQVMSAVGYSKADVESQLGALPDSVPVVLSFTANPTSGSLGLDLNQIMVGNLAVPGSSLGVDAAQLDPLIRDFFESTYGAGLDSLSVVDGSLQLDLQVPDQTP